MDKIEAWKAAVEIRKGDSELPDVVIIQAWIARSPETWIPALLRQCVASAVAKGCFKPELESGESGLVEFVRSMEAIARDWKDGANMNPPLCDKNGREFRCGDLVRTPHFRDRQRRKTRYLYHVVCATDGPHVELVPAQYLDPSRKDTGGRMRLVEGNREALSRMEIIYGLDQTTLKYYDER